MNTINPNQKLKWISAVVLVLATFSISRVSAGEIISFKVESPKNTDQNFMYAGDYAGAPGVRTNNWNNLHSLVDGSTSAQIAMAAGAVSNSAGTIVSGMSVVFQPCLVPGAINNRTAGGTNDGKMFADVADTYNCSGFSQFGYIDITNIPYASYNIYCYFRPDNGNGSANTRGGFWCITNTPTGTNRIYIQNQSNDVAQTQEPVPSNTGGNYVQSTTTAIGSGGVAWSTIQGGNYGVFSGLTNSNARVWFGGLGNGSGGKDDLGNFVNGGATAVRFKVCAFQIVQVPTGVATALYLASSNQMLHAGNPAGTQLTVLADLDTGATGVNETSGSTFVSDNTSVVTVSASGLMTPGTNGTAHVIATFQTKSVTNTVTVIGPTSLAISVAKTNLLVGNGQGDTTLATLLATYTDATNVAVNAYKFVSFGSGGGVTVTSNGIVTATAIGAFSITGSYDGLSTTTNNVGAVTAFSAPGSVAAFSVNLTDAGDPLSFHDLSGAPGGRVAYWNNMVMNFGNVTNQINNPVDYHGNALSGTVVQVLPNNTPQQAIVFGSGTRTTNESVLFNVFFDQGANNGTSQHSYIVVSNVPYASYDAYFYFQNDNASGNVVTNRPGQVTINGVTQYRINSLSNPSTPANDGSGYVQAVQPVSPPASCAQVPYGNYIKFASLTDATLNVDWGAVGQDVFLDAAGVTRVRLAGFQLVKSLGGLTATNIYLQSAVPAQLPGNPATYALTVLADFSDGEMGGNITALSGMGYASSNTNVFNVDASGVITPGLTPGVATLTVTYQTNTLTASVTNLAPTLVRVVAKPGTVYLDGAIGVTTSQAGVYADFPGYANLNIGSFSSVSFVDQGSAVATMDSAGAITASTTGKANLGVGYLGSTWVSTNAFVVRNVADAPELAHLYLFTNAFNSTVVVDTIGSANGTVFAALGTNTSISFDGSHAIFPGAADYSTAPYISLKPGIINQLGDVTVELWGGQTQRNAWARFFGFGSTAKGLDPHNTGAETSYLQLLASYSGSGHATAFTPSHGADAQATFSLTNGAQYQLVMVYAPNAGTAAFYINGELIGSGTPVSAPLSTSVNDTVDWLGVSLANTDPPLAGWMNKLAIYEGALSGSQIAASYAAGVSVYLPPSTVATNVVPVLFNVSGSNLNLSWPADHLGWTLQVQTNSLNSGLGTNWVPVPGSASTTNVVIPINPANGSVFYRLTYP
jgi:hypothetical protein